MKDLEVEVEALSSSSQAKNLQIAQLTSDLKACQEEKEWFITSGFSLVNERVRNGYEYVSLLNYVDEACFAVSYQDGLQDGYQLMPILIPFGNHKTIASMDLI